MTYELRLEVFEGPMDLLLYLIKKRDLDIYNIPIADITKEYLGYLEVIKQLQLDSAGAFLVMAATLIRIKTQMLLPTPETEGDEGPDPRAELVAKLLEYQKYKEAAKVLGEKFDVQRDVYFRQEPSFSKDDYVIDVSLFDLIGSFKGILSRAKDEMREILYDEIPIETKIREILSALERKEYIGLVDLFAGQYQNNALIATFLAMLELIRTRQIVARQAHTFGDIRIYRLRQPPEPSDQVPPKLETPPPTE
jgi:segregation and condensation protein A